MQKGGRKTLRVVPQQKPGPFFLKHKRSQQKFSSSDDFNAIEKMPLRAAVPGWPQWGQMPRSRWDTNMLWMGLAS